MFDFLDSDWFIVGLEIVFLLFIIYDTRLYIRTKKREYLFNIALALGFAVWTLYPFYTKYYTWQPQEREELIQSCISEHNVSYCECLDDKIFKAYDIKSYRALDKDKDEEYLEFLEASQKECREQ
jgi:hypothetical protein